MSRMILGTLAEYIGNLAPDGKLLIAGVFDGFSVSTISENMPAQVPPHWLLIRLGFQPSEGVEHAALVRLRDDDGREILSFGPIPITLHVGKIEGWENTFDWGNRLSDLTVPRCGTYSWEILVNGEMKGEVAFHVTRLNAPTPAQTFRKL